VDNSDLDTGAKVRPGGYPLTDDTYRKLVWQITKNPLVSPSAWWTTELPT